MTTTLRVVSLQAQNIMRLSAIEIKWDTNQSVLTIGGANGAGKSSAVQCVAMALGGLALCPEEPIRRGETQGHIELNLGELIVRREFWREVLAVGPATETGPGQPTAYGETKSRLVVRNTEGIKQEPAQKLLDRLIGKMTFDPMAFVSEEPKRQEEILRKIVNLDVSALETKRAAAYERRAHFNRLHRDAVAQLAVMPIHTKIPDAEISLSEISTEMRKAEELRVLADEETRRAAVHETCVAGMEASIPRMKAEVAELTQKLARTHETLQQLEASLSEAVLQLTAAKGVADKARQAVPDVSVIQTRLAEIEATNTKVRVNAAQKKATAECDSIKAKAMAEDAIVQEMEEAKRKVLESTVFPVAGLSLSDTGVIFHDIPFQQASTSEQIRVSVAIGFALNPGLKLLLVKNGNALDEDSMKLVAAEAEKAGGQILMEYVTKDASEVTVLIEDGTMAIPDTPAPTLVAAVDAPFT